MAEFIVVAFLIGSSFYDCRWKKIPVWLLAFGVFAGLVFKAVNIHGFEQGNWLLIIADLLPGICTVCMAWIWKEKIGLGDGLVLMTLGLFLGVEQTIFVAAAGLLLSALFGFAMLVMKKGTLQTALPFTPFLAVGVILVFGGNLYL